MIHPDSRTNEWIREVAKENKMSDLALVERVSRTDVPKKHAKFYYQVAYPSNRERHNGSTSLQS